MNSTTAKPVDAINLVMIPSVDQDRSIEFYERALGFEQRRTSRSAASTGGSRCIRPAAAPGLP